MAIQTTVNSNTNLILSWNQTDVDSNNAQNTVTDAGYFQHYPFWASGTGTGTAVNTTIAPQIKVYHIQSTLPSGGQAIYNMASLSKTNFSGTYSMSFTGVQEFYVENLANPNSGSGLGATIVIAATGASGFTGLFNGSGYHIIAPGSVFYLTNYWSGFACSGTVNTIFINDLGGSGSAYRLAVLGI